MRCQGWRGSFIKRVYESGRAVDTSDFPGLIQGLMRAEAYSHGVGTVEHIETHISHVFLAGDFAYKVKKPVDLGFLDFSTLERRHCCCEEEIRLNRRLADDIYLGVVPVCGTPAAPRVEGSGPVLEYAVKMYRFAQESLLDRQEISAELMIRLGELVADFHAGIPVARPDSDFGSPQAVLDPMLENLAQVRERAIYPENLLRLGQLETWTRARHLELIPVLEQRRLQGYVRECHGDMHRGNIALVKDRIRIFDAIEFNPNLRWIDTASELAFLIMDLEQAGERGSARLLLNRYLECSGDFGALAVLDFYKVYRAMVRAKVLAIRLDQIVEDPTQEVAIRGACTRYLRLAESYTRPRRPSLVMVCGLPGSGKTCLAYRLREAMPFIHLRSDVERKRLFGLKETATTLSAVDGGIYFPSANDWTYDRLYRLAGAILASRYDVLVDATFIARSRRRRFIDLANRYGAAYAIIALDAPLDVLRQRVICRLTEGNDVSEANVSVLESQYAGRQDLAAEERTRSILIDTSHAYPFRDILARLRDLLGQDPNGDHHAFIHQPRKRRNLRRGG